MENSFDLSAIKVLFLDIGGVLLTNGWSRESRQAAAREFGFDFSEMEKRHDLMFDIYELGRVTLDDYLDAILFYQERPFSKEDFRQFIFHQSKPLPQMLEWMIGFRAQHPHLRIFSLNNEPKELHLYRVQHFNLRQLYDGFVSSCDVGVRKPDPKIYELAVGVAGVLPAECLYIDDREPLVAAGEKAGLRGWTHQSAEQTIAFLQSLQRA
jgi:putative hydrolase of the HAD superfamily